MEEFSHIITPLYLWRVPPNATISPQLKVDVAPQLVSMVCRFLLHTAFVSARNPSFLSCIAFVMPLKCTTPFNNSHTLTYGLKVCELVASTKNVVSVSCRFCVYFGQEEDGAKRKPTTNIQYCQRPFRTDV